MWLFLIMLCSMFLSLHFFRMGLLLLTLISLSLIPLSFIRKKWSLITIKLIILLGTLDWIRTLFRIIKDRMHEGRPWLIAFIILSIVILIHISTLLVLRKRAVKEKFI
ncbi:MAG: hypothetical protein N2202_08290 [Proteobacteria bacterium]|nr:hypothetical protein [Pseudomonadota bacterium]